MLQVPFIRDNQKLVLEGLAKRNFVNAKEIVGRVLETDETRRNIQASLDNTLAESNAISKEIGLLFKTGQVQKAALAKEKSKKLKDQLKSIDVSTKFLIVEEGRITSKKTRIISSQQQVVRFDHENTNPIKNITHKRVITYLQENITKYDVILLSDYGKRLLTFDLT